MSYAGLGDFGIPGFNSTALINGIVQKAGPPIADYVKQQIPVLVPAVTDELKKQIPGFVTAIKPEVQKGINQLMPILQNEGDVLAQKLWTAPSVQQIKREVVVGAVLFAGIIIAGTWAAVKYVDRI